MYFEMRFLNDPQKAENGLLRCWSVFGDVHVYITSLYCTHVVIRRLAKFHAIFAHAELKCQIIRLLLDALQPQMVGNCVTKMSFQYNY